MRKILFIFLTIPLVISAQYKNTESIQSLKTQLSFNAEKVENGFLDLTPPQISEKKSAGIAVLYSLLLPGMGELYAGRYDVGKFSTIADGALWITFAGFNMYGAQQRDNYKSYAQSFAGVDSNGKDDIYYANIGAYINVEEYNNQMLLDRDFENVYDENTHYWEWQTNNNRLEYKNTWTSSESAYNNLKFVAGALVLNRLISVINAIRFVSAHNKQLENKVSWDFSVGMKKMAITLPTSLTVNFNTNF